MAYNKSKYVETAQKYLHQGKIPQAIAEYQSILKHEPKDQVTLMTIGDLYVRRGETFRALEYFERLAQLFLQDGFTTKAIAIYKKVAKLAPEEGRPLERLAELYVQQGVLSEARPLFLQLAEMHLRAGRQPQAAALLKRLLEAEPDNLRVQVRLAELYLTMGQQKDALEMFLGAAERVLDRGDQAETVRLTDRVLQLDTEHRSALLLKARALSASGENAEAIALLEPLSEHGSEVEVAKQLFELYLAASQTDKAAALADRMITRDSKNYAPAHHAAALLLESGGFDQAQSLLGRIRNAMADAGDQEVLARSLTKLADGRPDALEPAEWLVELYSAKNDGSRLPGALLRLARALTSAGDNAKALETYQQLLSRTPIDPAAQQEYAALRIAMGMEPVAQAGWSAPVSQAQGDSPAVPSTPPAFDEETERYVTQALTDVDLFSSYGLTQKAVELLEDILRAAPQHIPALERLLDLSVGAGNDRRTVELASTLEHLAQQAGDEAGAERYAELSRRFNRGSGEPPSAPAAPAVPEVAATLVAPEVSEFAVPLIEAELIEGEPIQENATEAQASVAEPSVIEPAPSEPAKAPPAAEGAVHEVDLSEEWAALSQEIEDSAQIVRKGSDPRETAGSAAPEQEPVLDDEAYEFELRPEDGSDAAEPLPGDALLSELAHAENGKESTREPAEAPAGNAKTNGAPNGLLSDLFDQFRSEMGDSGPEKQDPETHYNLGVAYREMGLLDEAISEFQKVHKGDPTQAFRYAMQCCTLLAMAFREKGQPAIAAMWYERALLTPDLDPESVLALRYDLGVAQELAGDTAAAFKSFSQVYSMNIDYRDVAERVALLGKAHESARG